MHYNRKLDYDIPNYMITMYEKKPLLLDKEVQGVMFFSNDYKLPYMSTNETGYNYFVYLDGKINFLDGYIYLNDQTLGHIIIENKNIISIELKEEIKYTYILLKLSDSSKLPLAGIAKPELLLYFSNSSIKSYKTDLFNTLKADYKVDMVGLDKTNFYYKLAYFIYENERENINYTANGFYIEKIKSILTNHLEYENVSLRLKNKDKELTFDEFTQIRKLQPSNTMDNKKIKLLMVFGSINSSNNVFAEYIQDAAKSISKNSSIIKIKKNELSSLKAYVDYIAVSANSNLDKSFNKMLIMPIGLDIEIPVFLYKIADYFGGFAKFFEIFEIINICYSVNYSCFLRNSNNDLFKIFKHITQDELCKFVLIDESDVSKRKVDRFNSLIQGANKNAIFYNKRTFTRNPKDTKKIVTDSHFNESYLMKLYSMDYFKMDKISNMLTQSIHGVEEQLFFKTEFYILREKFDELVTKYLNYHMNPINMKDNQKESLAKKKEDEKIMHSHSNRYMNNFDFQDDLIGKYFLIDLF